MKLTNGSIDFFDIPELALVGVTIRIGNDEHVLATSFMFDPEERNFDSLGIANVLRDLANVLESA